MGQSRNQRSKREGTFLEYVKDALKSLQEEMSAIKNSIEDLKLWHTWAAADPCAQWYGPYHEPSACADLGHLGDHWIRPDCESISQHGMWEALFTPPVCMPIPRDTLLSYRLISGSAGQRIIAAASVQDTMRAPIQSTRVEFWQLPSVGTWFQNSAFAKSAINTGTATSIQSIPGIVAKRGRLEYLQWSSSSGTDVFTRDGSTLRNELEEEAAVVIQRWFRGLVLDDEPLVSTESDEDGEQSAEELQDEDAAVVKAFVLSLDSTQYAWGSPSNVADEWTFDQVNAWLTNAISRALEAPSRTEGARDIWREWPSAEKHLPRYVHTRLVKFIDDKLSSMEFPSLRELVAQSPRSPAS